MTAIVTTRGKDGNGRVVTIKEKDCEKNSFLSLEFVFFINYSSFLLFLPVRVQGPLWSIDALVTMYKVTVRRQNRAEIKVDKTL